MSGIAIEVEGLTKSFGQLVAVRGITLKVAEGTIFGFLGPNGSGKTTTIRLLCGLLTPDAGRGTCLGYDIVTQSDEIKRHVGYMTQRFSLYRDLSVRENLEFTARVYGMREPRKAARAAIDRLGLGARSEQLAGTLSGGWQQRLALGACILPSPRLLLLDEPTAGVDPQARREFWNHIHHLAAEGITVLVSTHYMDEAERCHEIAYIFSGELLTRGTAGEVVARSGLVTWIVTGPELQQVADRLAGMAGIEMVAAYGTTLHVSGPDEKQLNAAVAEVRAGDDEHQWSRGEPGLEDVFIHLTNEKRDGS
jgi:ABC-2 type transport system ATP-binding protein